MYGSATGLLLMMISKVLKLLEDTAPHQLNAKYALFISGICDLH